MAKKKHSKKTTRRRKHKKSAGGAVKAQISTVIKTLQSIKKHV